QLGPESYAWAVLRCLPCLTRGPELQGWLDEARGLLSQMRSRDGVARAELTAAWLRGHLDPSLRGSLDVLLRPENADAIVECAPWLLPLLIQAAPPTSEVERALVRLARDCPREWNRQVPSLSPSEKVSAAAIIGLVGGQDLRPALDALATDPDASVREAARRAASAVGTAQGPPLLRLFSFGAFEVFRGEERVPEQAWKSQKVRYLLACLAAHGGSPVSEELLLENFWPEDLERGRQNLHTASSYVRSTLRGERRDLDYVVRTPSGLQLNPELPWWHDLVEFERALETGLARHHEGRAEEAVDLLRRAVRLYRAAYLEGCYFEWAQSRRSQLERRVVESLAILTDLCARLERLPEAVEHGKRWLEVDPCSQEACRAVMRSSLQLGRGEEAVKAFQVCRKALREDLGMDPALDLEELHQRALLNL
ncbi:MAG: BTAD domain-containing putative transcriptional regulator, partial [Candidatus Eremiobacterota bacterium]